MSGNCWPSVSLSVFVSDITEYHQPQCTRFCQHAVRIVRSASHRADKILVVLNAIVLQMNMQFVSQRVVIQNRYNIYICNQNNIYICHTWWELMQQYTYLNCVFVGRHRVMSKKLFCVNDDFNVQQRYSPYFIVITWNNDDNVLMCTIIARRQQVW